MRSEEAFSIQVRKKGKIEMMRFCSEYAKDVITETLKFQSKFSTDSNILKRPVFMHINFLRTCTYTYYIAETEILNFIFF